MEVGQVSYKNSSKVKFATVEKNSEIVKRLNKTLIIAEVDFKQEKDNYLKERANQEKKRKLDLSNKKIEEEKKKKEEIFLKQFQYIDDLGSAQTNKEGVDEYDFW
jgi:cobalamin biosynthesis protein CbiG